MKTAKRLLAALLATLTLATPLLAAGPYEANHQSRAEDLTFLVENLEKVHPDLYANTTREAMAAKKAYIMQNMDNWDDSALSMEYRALIGMVGDSHTKMGVKLSKDHRKFSAGILLMGGKLIVAATTKEQAKFLGAEITAVNGYSLEQVQKKLGTFLCADNSAWALRTTSQMIYVWDILVHFGIISAEQQSLDLTVRDQSGAVGTMNIVPLSTQQTNDMVTSGQLQNLMDLRTGAAATEPDGETYYKWLDLGGGNLYVQYNVCMEDPKLPMADFAAQVSEQLKTSGYGRVILDLRNNTGGSDGVIWDLLYEILPYQQRGVELYTLIGDSTFSSGIINAVQLKQLGATMVGGPTGGSVDHFGSVSTFELPNSGWKINYSNKFIEMGSFYQAAAPYNVESLQPDVAVVQTVADYLAGVDTVVQSVLKIPVTALAATAPAAVSQAKVLVDGQASALTGYLIGGEHYVALRDAAAALSGTAAQFDVVWTTEAGMRFAGILLGAAYTPIGGELAALPEAKEASAVTSMLLTDQGMPLQMLGQPGSLRVYNIQDRHYLRLRDLGAKLGFDVSWDAQGETVQLTAQKAK